MYTWFVGKNGRLLNKMNGMVFRHKSKYEDLKVQLAHKNLKIAHWILPPLFIGRMN